MKAASNPAVIIFPMQTPLFLALEKPVTIVIDGVELPLNMRMRQMRRIGDKFNWVMMGRNSLFVVGLNEHMVPEMAFEACCDPKTGEPPDFKGRKLELDDFLDLPSTAYGYILDQVIYAWTEAMPKVKEKNDGEPKPELIRDGTEKSTI